VQRKKLKLVSTIPIPALPFRLPEDDAFLYTTNYSSWIEVFLTKSDKKENLSSLLNIKRGFYYA